MIINSMPNSFIFYLVITVCALGVTPLLLQDSYAQTSIPVNASTPCWQNDTAGAMMWENCGAGEDYIEFALLPWEYITGGYFSMVIVSIFVLFSYIKYHKIVYPIITGILFLPISYFIFPQVFLVFSILMAFVGVGIIIWYVVIKQTKEF